MNNLVLEMNRVALEWQERFDPAFGSVVVFSEEKCGVLYVNGRVLIPLLGLELSSASFEEDLITFGFEDGRRLEVAIGTTEEDEPYVESALFGYMYMHS